MIYRSLSTATEAALRLVAPLADAALRERLVLDRPGLPRGAIWVHGASVGELNSARVVIQRLAARHPVLVTANTVTGRSVAQGWGLPARLAPLDGPGTVRRFLDAAAPRLAVTIENEIWPNRAAALRARGVPQAVIGARMSARSARGWGRARGLIAPVLGGLDVLSAQDQATEARLLDLGLAPSALAPRMSLKLIGPAGLPPPPEVPERGQVWLAASTHPGEEAVVLDTHRSVQAQARLILAPRHPKRADEVAALIAARGWPVVRLGPRSVAEAGTPAVLLVDRLGAMPEACAASGICLTGGSLVDRGGHTPWEPASQCCALLHGPHVANFAADYAALDAVGASLPVTADSLAGTLAALLGDEPRRQVMGGAARAALDAAAPDPVALVDRLLALADPALRDAAGADIGGP